MRLETLFRNTNFNLKRGTLDLDVRNLCSDSRKAQPGDLFACVRGFKQDGRQFVNQAITNGSVAILTDAAIENSSPDVALIEVDSVRETLPQIAANFFGHPSKELAVVGITGTNGKTTITYLLESILRAEKFNSGVIGTVNYRFKDRVLPAAHTTPEAYEIQKLLREMVDDNISHVAMEISSHALSLHRADQCSLRGAILTNITQDHLDFHTDMESYAKTKFSITHLVDEKDGFFLTYGDDDAIANQTAKIASATSLRCATFGLDRSNSFQIVNPKFALDGMTFKLVHKNTQLELSSALSGHHNALNVAAAASAAHLLGLSEQSIVEGVRQATRIPGRLDRISSKHGVHVFVDYAHTADALLNVTGTMNQLVRESDGASRLITVFGCGGDRDRSKRPQMGLTAIQNSNIAIVTSDNPRTEDPDRIIADIVQPNEIKTKLVDQTKLLDGLGTCTVEVNRKKAIQLALRCAKPNDLVLIAGKGHEDYQEINGVRHTFSDREVTVELMKEMGWTVDFA